MDMQELRHAIDAVNDRLLDLLLERQNLASQLGDMKRDMGLPIYDQIRERDILARLTKRNAGRLADQAVLAAWREIFSASRQAQTKVRVAYLGPEGTFTQQAALNRFGTSVEYIASHTISAAFGWLTKETVDFAVLPVENTLQGVVGETVDLLGSARRPLVVGEVTIPVHFVFSSTNERLENIRTVYSKQEAFLQCTNFLGQPALEQAVRAPVSSTTEAVRRAADDPTGAALSSEIAATLNDVPILFRNVGNNARNKTRFLVLGHDQPQATGNDKTSVFAKVPHVAGGLEGLLAAFKSMNINLSKIESRPMDDAVNFETWFYIEFDGHRSDLAGSEIFEKYDLVWLGSYPRF